MAINCCRNSEGGTVVRDTIVLGLALCISFGLLIAAGIVDNIWLPLINLGAVVLVPMAVILTETIGGGSALSGYDEGRQAWANFGSCFFGTILISLFGLPLVLYHVGNILRVGFALWMTSTVVTFLGAIFYWTSRQKRNDL